MKVVQKQIILVAIAIVGMVWIAWSGYTAIYTIKQDADVMNDSIVKSIDYIGKANYGIRYAQGMVATALVVKNDDPDRAKSLQKKYADAVKIVQVNLDSYNALEYKDNDVANLMYDVERSWLVVHDDMDKVMKLVQEGQYEEAVTAYNRNIPSLMSGFGRKSDAIMELEKFHADNMIEDNNEVIKNATIGILIKFLLIMAVMTAVSVIITKKITTPLYNMIDAMDKMEKGDFQQHRRMVVREDEFGLVADKMAVLRDNLRNLMLAISASSEEVAASSHELNASSQQSAQAADQVAQSVTRAAHTVMDQNEDVAAAVNSIEAMAGSIDNLNHSATNLSHHAEESRKAGAKGNEVLEITVSQIEHVSDIVLDSAATVDSLGKRSEEVGKIVGTISSIAEQVNLLALNAAIEAARAGVYGRGFAVVAEEIRNLAEESEKAARSITNIVDGVQADTAKAVAAMQSGSQAVNEGTRVMNDLRETFDHIQMLAANVAAEAEAMNRDIESVATETTIVRKKSDDILQKSCLVSSEMQSVSAASEEQSASSNGIADASESLAKLAKNLQVYMQKFQV